MAVQQQQLDRGEIPRRDDRTVGVWSFTRLNVSRDASRALGGLNLYRWAVAVILTLVQFSGYGARVLGITQPALFAAGCLGLMALALATTTMHNRRRPALSTQIYLHACGDVGLIILLVYAAGGAASGLAMLLIPPIAASGILLARERSLLIGSLATLALLGEELVRQYGPGVQLANFTQAGILGAMFFLIVLAVSLLEERIRESEALAERQSEDLANLAQINERIVQRIQSGVLVVNPDGGIRMHNDAAGHLLGLEEDNTGRTLQETALDLAQSLQEWQANPEPEPSPLSQRQNPPLLPHYTRLGTTGNSPTLILLDDASRIEQQAQQMKLAALGRLSASIAHEIRNPLGAINHATQLLDESDSVGDSQRRILDILRRQTTRINQVVENVLQLSRRNRALTENITLKTWLQGTITEYENYGQKEKLVFDDSAVDLQASIEADPNQMRQVICNLWDNAYRHKGGNSQVVITLSSGFFPDGRCWLNIKDNGPGIPPDKIERIFDPFFTDNRKGTGLGLYLAQELCASNGAQLQCLPQPGGACFRIIFRRGQE